MATQNAREKFIAFVKANGWTPDVRTTRRKRVRVIATGDFEYRDVQDPFAFVKPGPDGGQWRIYLDYRLKSSWSGGTGNTLQGIAVGFYPTTDSQEGFIDFNSLVNADRGHTPSYNKHFWDALRQPKPDGSASLKDAAELLIKDPTTSVWLALQAQHDAEEAERARVAAVRKDHEERSQPLPITVPNTGWGSEWKRRTYQLKSVATQIDNADGKADLVQLVTDMVIAVESIQAALNDEAEQAVSANLFDFHTKLTEQDAEALKKFLQS